MKRALPLSLLLFLITWLIWSDQHQPNTQLATTQTPKAELPKFPGVDHHAPSALVKKPDPFATWADTYVAATPTEQIRLLEGGLALAEARGVSMRRWMRENPERAWVQALPLDVYANLPEAIASVIEQPIAGTGDVVALSGCAGNEPRYQLHLDGERLRLHAFGRRSGLPSKRGVSVYGIRLDQEVVLNPSPVHRLAASEFEAASERFEIGPRGIAQDALTGAVTTGQTRTLVGGQVLAFEDPRSMADLEATLNAVESLLGPDIIEPIRILLASGGDVDLPDLYSLALKASSQWTETPKKVLFLRVDFSDLTGNPISDSELDALITTSSDQIAAMSYGKTSVTRTVSQTIYRLPKTAAQYLAAENSDPNDNLGASDIAADTKAAVTSEGTYALDDFDIHVYLFANFGISDWAGLASLGGSNHWINGSFSPETMVHEFGHNYGLRHARYWLTSDGTSFGAGGGEVDYGDLFDIMGSGELPSGHFNMWSKHQLNWLEGPEVSAIDEEGTYRIHRIDDASTSGTKGLRAEGITGGGSLWVGYRPGQATNPRFSSGAYVTWVGPNDISRLIDTTPDSEADETADRQDSPLQVGQTLTVPRTSGEPLLITPLGYGGLPPNNYIDVYVRTGTFAGNQSPSSLNISGPGTAVARSGPITFTGSATDADGDPIIYAWDFGDGTPSLSGPTVEKAFPSSGTFTITLTAADGKGGITEASASISVTDSWVARTYSGAGQLKHLAYGNGRYVAIGRQYGAHSTDGMTWTQSTAFGGNQIMERVAYGNGVFVAVGQDYNFGVAAWQGLILRSTNDGQSWSSTLSGEARKFESVTYGGGSFVAVGGGGMIYTSTDGQTWSPRTNPAPSTMDLESVAYANGVIVVAGNSTLPSTFSPVYRSVDNGTSWTSVSVPNFFTRKVVHDGTRFVILTSYSGRQDLITSTDGMSWNYEDIDIEISGADLVGSESFYHIVGSWAGANRNAVSLDRQAWFTSPSHSATNSQNGLAMVNGRLFSVGDNGSIYELTTFSPGSPMITTQPGDNAALAGEMVTTSLSATGDATLTYQWYQGSSGDESQPVSGQTSHTLSVIAPASPTAYWAKVSNSQGSEPSGAAWLRTHQIPSVGAIADQTVAFNASGVSVSVSLSDDLTPANTLDLSITSSMPTVIDASDVLSSTVGGDASITFSPQPNVSGQSTLTLYVTDEHGGCQHVSFVVTVSPHTPADPVIFRQDQDLTLYLSDHANPYPSTLEIAGLRGTVTKTRLALEGITTSRLINAVYLLEDPSGNQMIPFYAVGRGTSVEDLDLAFEDGAAQTIQFGITPENGLFAPSHQSNPMNYQFPAPAPARPHGSAFSEFTGAAPNGTWQLYQDDPLNGSTIEQAGSVDAWEVWLWTSLALSDWSSWLTSRQLPIGTDPNSDPDNNTLSLLQEYAFGVDPAKGEREPEVDGGVTGSTARLVFDRRKGSDHGLTYHIEENAITPDPDDGNWMPATVQSTNVLQDRGDDTEQVEALVDTGSGARKFLRARVTMP